MAQVTSVLWMAQEAKRAWKELSLASTEQKNRVLELLAEKLNHSHDKILEANQSDVEDAKAAGMEASLIDRLSLKGRLEGMISDIKSVVNLPDPVGRVIERKVLGNGLHLRKVKTAIGLIGVIYESRPNVTIDVSILAIKSGNCVLLRGGSETLSTNAVLVELIRESLAASGLPPAAVQFVHSSDRTYVSGILQLHNEIDLIIPRGGAALHAYCREHSRIPVITGGIGICHLFLDASADLNKSLEVVHNAKTQRPTVCNALDTLLIHEEVADCFLPRLFDKLGAHKVKFRVDAHVMRWLALQDSRYAEACELAGENDWDTEWLSLVLGVKMVKDLGEAIAHIQKHSSGHSDGILTENKAHAAYFVQAVDSCAVYVNASTRFTDGGQFGLGAEVAISTQKLHARGPMGLEELTTYKWIGEGAYLVRRAS